jgi:hypothetical protein
MNERNYANSFSFKCALILSRLKAAGWLQQLAGEIDPRADENGKTQSADDQKPERDRLP